MKRSWNRRWAGKVTPASPAVTAEVIREDAAARSRDRCTVCGRKQEWFQLEPGTGRCTTCQP